MQWFISARFLISVQCWKSTQYSDWQYANILTEDDEKSDEAWHSDWQYAKDNEWRIERSTTTTTKEKN